MQFNLIWGILRPDPSVLLFDWYDMTKDAVHAVRDFVAHIDAQARARQEVVGSGSNFEASPDEKARRDTLMQDLLVALGMTKAELQAQLGIGRATWDRWRAISSIPHRSHLETLARFAAEQIRNDGKDAKLPSPHEMLNAGRRTWGRLRLVYSLYHWRNAVFSFKNTFSDDLTATEMALLAFRQCNIVYLMSNADQWRQEFTENLVYVLGKNYAARALSRFCIIEISEEIASEMPEFGIFNFETKDPDDCVGYIWKGLGHSEKRPERDIAADQYDVFPATDDRYTDVRDKYWSHIQSAINTIYERVPDRDDFWSPNMEAESRKELLVIPIIKYQDQDKMSGST